MSNLVKYCSTSLTFVGLLLSLYALHVEISKEKDENYTAYCDINENMSCSRVFGSRYGKGFGFLGILLGNDSILNLPNPVYGIVFYGSLMVLGEVDSYRVNTLQLGMAILSNIGSGYLAYILYFILHDLCLVCVTTYFVNAALLVCYILQRPNSVVSKNEMLKKKE